MIEGIAVRISCFVHELVRLDSVVFRYRHSDVLNYRHRLIIPTVLLCSGSLLKREGMALRQVAWSAFKVRDVGSTAAVHWSKTRPSSSLHDFQRRTLYALLPYPKVDYLPYPSTAAYSSKSGDSESSHSTGSRRLTGDRKSRSATGSGSASAAGGNGGNGDKESLKCPKCGESCIHVETFVCKYQIISFSIFAPFMLNYSDTSRFSSLR